MEEREQQFSRAVITLMQQVVSREASPALWNVVTTQNAGIQEYVEKMGLRLVIDGESGYAFLQQDTESGLPRLVRRRPLTFQMSLFLALLRNESNEFDGAHGDTDLVVTKERMTAQMRMYYPQITDEVKFENKITAMFRKAEDMKFLERIPGGEEAYAVQPILRSFINAEWLSQFRQALTVYMEKLAAGEADAVSGEDEE